MRILFLSRWFPYPPDNGSKIRIYNLIKGFYPDHQVDLITFFENENIQKYIPHLCKFVASVQAFPYKKFKPGGLKAILGFLSPYPRSVVDTYSEDISAAVKKAVAEKGYDLVIASEIDMSIYARAVRGPRKIFEEIEITKLITQIKTEKHPVRKLRSRLTWWKLSWYLRKIIDSFDGCTVVSEAEQKAVHSVFPKYEPAVIPNGVDTRMITPNGSVDIEASSMIFTGAITYEVNYQAVAYFIKEIFPLIRVKRPDAHLYVTGRVNQSLIDRLPSCDGITFTGYLEDVRSMLTKCSVNVVPLTIGGGTRLKVLESLAAGVPIVSTSFGAEGLNLIHGHDILIADEPSAFADAVIDIFNHSDLRRALVTNGRKTVVEKYDWSLINHLFGNYINKVMKPQIGLESKS